MRPSRTPRLIPCLILLVSTACSLPASIGKAPSTPTPRPRQTRTAAPPPTVLASPTAASASMTAAPSLPTTAATLPPVTLTTQVGFCGDGQVPVLIGSFRSAILTSNGPLLASLVSPTHGMDARLYRNGRVVNYDVEHAKFLFTSTFAVDWGLAPGSGLETSGSFHELIVPALVDVFNRAYTLRCDQVQVGGTTYQATWPYPGIDFYSAYYPGTEANGNMDWHTWLLGVHYVGAKPYLYAIMQFQWEP